METGVAIIGGGVAGLAAALALCERGRRATVVEMLDAPGGRARSWAEAGSGDVLDIGPHVVSTEHRCFLRLLEALGTARHIHWERDRLLQVVEGRCWTPITLAPLPAPLHLVPGWLRAPLSWSELLSNRRAISEGLRANEQRVLELDAIDAASWLGRCGVAPRSVDWFWRTVTLAILNAPLEQCSAGALLRFLGVLLRRRHLRFGAPTVPLSTLFAEPARAAVRARGGEVLCGRRALALVHEAGRWTITLEGGATLTAGQVLLALPPRETLDLLGPLGDSVDGGRGAMTAFQPSPYVSLTLWFEQAIATPAFWSRIWSPDAHNLDFYALSRLREDWRGRGNTVITSNMVHATGARALPDDALVSATLAELRENLPAFAGATLRHATVRRISMAIPRPAPGTERLRPGARTRAPGLFLAGDWTRTCLPASMESAAASGETAARAAMEG